MVQSKIVIFQRLCQILGLGPISTKVGYAYQVVLLAAYLIVSAFAINDEIIKLYANSPNGNVAGDISSTITQIQHLFNLFVEVTWLACVLFYREYYKSMLEHVGMVSERLDTMSINSTRSNYSIRKIYFVGVILVIIIISIRISAYKYLCSNCGICAQISSILADILSTMGVFQFFIYAHVISSIFQTINNQLDLLKERISISRKELDRQVYALASCHQTASNTATEFIDAFMYQILIFVTNVFLKTLFTTYLNTNRLLSTRLLETNLWNVIVLLLLITIIHSCTSVCELAKNTSRLVHVVIRETYNENDDALSMMSLQLIHRPIELVCAGMFPINYTILYKLTVTATIYIVILVQFDQVKEPSNGN